MIEGLVNHIILPPSLGSDFSNILHFPSDSPEKQRLCNSSCPAPKGVLLLWECMLGVGTQSTPNSMCVWPCQYC